jgi:hypothetical protein
MSNAETIGERAFSECLRLWGTPYKAAKELGCCQSMVIYKWGRGLTCPQAYFLANMYASGADIKYILLGVRENELS